MRTVCQCISPHLVDGIETIIMPSSDPLFGQKQMIGGNMPRDGGNLILNQEDCAIAKSIKELRPYIRPFLGSKELLTNKNLWCLWMVDAPDDVFCIPFVSARLEKCRQSRLASKANSTRDAAKFPHLFVQRPQPENARCLAVPVASSENRYRLPMAFIESNVVANNCVLLIPNADIYDFGILSSRMYNVWLLTVSGRLELRIHYSRSMCYNTFPWPKQNQVKSIERISKRILQERKKQELTLGDMYRPVLMPAELKKLHSELDNAVDCLYSPIGFASDAERLRHLFYLYKAKANQQSASIDRWY